MERFIGGVLIGLGVLTAVSVLWRIFKAKLSPGAQTTGDKVLALADEGLLLTLLAPVWMLAKKRGDAVIVGLLAQVRAEAAKWDDDIPAPTPTLLQTPSEALKAMIQSAVDEALKAQPNSTPNAALAS